MKTILAALVLVAPMTVAAEEERMQQQNPADLVRDIQAAKAQNDGQWDEVTKGRVQRAADAAIRNLFYGVSIVNEFFEKHAEGKEQHKAVVTGAPIMIAGYEQIIANMQPHMKDLEGLHISQDANNKLYIGRITASTDPATLIAANRVAALKDDIQFGHEVLRREGLAYDKNSSLAQAVLKELEAKMPPRGAFEFTGQ